MKASWSNTVFYFETQFPKEAGISTMAGSWRLEPDRLVEMTWLTGATKGVETVVTVELATGSGGATLRLTHAGFPDEESRDRHHQAWPSVLAHLDQRMAGFE